MCYNYDMIDISNWISFETSSIEECIDHCEKFDDCTAAEFRDYGFCFAYKYCLHYSSEGVNGFMSELAILA